jgi:hypothetical protein
MSGQRGAVRREESDASGSAADGDGAADEPTEQEVYDVLSNRRRRYALYALLRDGSTTIGSLAERIAAWENDHPVTEVTPAERKRVYTALQQSHLPKLERTGLVEFDPDSGRISPTDTAADLDGYLDVGGDRPPWSRYYLGLSTVAAVVVVAVWFDVPPFGALSPLVWLTLVVGCFAASAAVHTYRSGGTDGAPEPPEVTRQS